MAHPVREFGHFPLSIGTSRALEGLYTLERSVEPSGSAFVDNQRQRMVMNNTRLLSSSRTYGALWVNLETLVRNVTDAYSKDDLKAQLLSNLVQDVFDDIEAMQSVVEEYDGDERHLTLYVEDPSERKWQYPNTQWRTPTTKAQIEKQYFHTTILSIVQSSLLSDGQPLQVIKRQPNVSYDAVLMLTHFPHQLFWSQYFSQLLLLESYTGVLKERSQWNSKLKGITHKDPMPFNPFTLQVLGDGQLFSGESRVVQKELKSLAETANWTKVTSREKLYHDIKTRGGVVLQEVYNKTMVMF